MNKLFVCLSYFFVLIPAVNLPVWANVCETEKVLTSELLFRSIDESFPLLKQSRQRIIKAEKELLSSQGNFDLKLKIKSGINTLGYYQNTSFDAFLEQPTQFYGMTLFGGYQLGRGRFPAYYGNLETNSLGEFQAGLETPLIRDLFIDANRAGLNLSKLEISYYQEKVYQDKIKFLSTAIKSYWQWFETGYIFKLNQELLTKAEQRNDFIRQSVELGAISPLEIIENQKAIMKRKSQLLKAGQLFTENSNLLRLYLDECLAANILDVNNLPDRPLYRQSSFGLEKSMEFAKQNRPEFRILNISNEQNLVEQRLNRNNLLPALNLKVFFSKDVGQPGQYSKSEPELNAYLLFSYPFQNRKETGKYEKTLVVASELSLQKEFLQNQIKVEISNIINNIENTYEQIIINENELKLAKQLEDSEKKLMRLGSSSLFKLNLREQFTTETEIRLIQSISKYNLYLDLYNLAIGKSSYQNL